MMDKNNIGIHKEKAKTLNRYENKQNMSIQDNTVGTYGCRCAKIRNISKSAFMTIIHVFRDNLAVCFLGTSFV